MGNITNLLRSGDELEKRMTILYCCYNTVVPTHLQSHGNLENFTWGQG